MRGERTLRRLPNFTLLRTFEAAARLESFTLAAHELHLTQSAISHQIKELERYFERSLFVRSHRRVEPTAEAKRLLESLSRVFDVLESACQEVSLSPQAEVLSLYCAPSFAVKWLGPRLRGFMNAHSSITIRLSTGPGTLDLNRARDTDIAITYGAASIQTGVSSFSLGEETIVPICAPALLDKYQSVADCIQSNPLLDSQLSPVKWPDWFSHHGMACPDKPRTSFDRAALAIAAAVDGMGIALESSRLAEREISRGEVTVLSQPGRAALQRPLHFVSFRDNERASGKVKAFMTWLDTQTELTGT